jgi:hypothetical protein
VRGGVTLGGALENIAVVKGKRILIGNRWWSVGEASEPQR